MNPQHRPRPGAGWKVGLLSNGKHNADRVLGWFGKKLEERGAQVLFARKEAPSGPAEEVILDRLATCSTALVGTAD